MEQQILLNFFGKYLQVISIDISMNVLDLKRTIEEKLFIPANFIVLKKATSLLDDKMVFEDLNLVEGNTIDVDLRVLGGSCRYKKAHSKMRWKSKLKRARRLQRARRKMRNRAK
tara:strand:+ start:2087 stop:2428 length:342 start_codon:yes stop_codon:yes gene_type:complete